MITSDAIEAAALLYELRERGCNLALRPSIDANAENPEPPVLAIDGAEYLDDTLRERIRTHKVQLKLLVLFDTPPQWLRDLARRCIAGTMCEVRRANPASGRVEPYVVRVREKQVAAAVASEVGAGSYEDVIEETRDFLEAGRLGDK